jgi:N-acetylmuramoyl-L-alanine amidase
MAVKPNITWIGSPNFGFPDGTHGQNEPEAIVYHIAQGSLAGIDAWFNNPKSYASTHFAVGLGGVIHQYVRVEDAAWGNGVMNAPDMSIPWLKFCWENEINPNLKTISIEHEGFTGDPWPEAMYQASRALTVWLVDAHNLRHFLVALDDRFIGHYKIDSVQRANCPGTGWPRARLFQDLGRLEDVYVPRNRTIYKNRTFGLPSSGVAHQIYVDVTAYGYPSQATAVDLLLGCRSRGDGAYVAAYDGTTGSLSNAAVYPTAPLRYDWNFGRGRVQLDGSKFLLSVRPIDHPVDVIASLKGYYALE